MRNFRKLSFSANKRRFKSTWFKENPWLRYSVSSDWVYCVYCVLFGVKRSDVKKKSFISTPIRDWSRFSKYMSLDISHFPQNTMDVLMQLSISFPLVKIQEDFMRVLLSYCKFWIYWVGVNTKFTIWQQLSYCKFCIYTWHYSE